MRRLISLSFLTVVSLWFVNRTSAQEFIVNGGFETGDLTGWTQIGNTGFTGVVNNPAGAHSGTFYFSSGPVGSLGGITQTAATTAGANYTLSFWLQNLGGTPNEMQVMWEGNVIFDTIDAPADAAYVNHTFNLTAAN